MDWLISVILISVISFYLLGWIGKSLLRRWIARKQQQFSQQFSQEQGRGFSYTWGGRQRTGNDAQGAREKEGEIRLEQTQMVDKKVNRNVGNYVEYEEVSEPEKQ